MDDLDPVAHARHAAVLRSPFAYARITRLDPTAALELPGVVGVLTGADVAELSRPFPAGIDSPIPHYAAAHEVTRYVGEPVAVVVARDRYLAEDALELIEVAYEPLAPVLDSEAAVDTDACVSDRSFHYGDVEGALARADLVVRERFRFHRWSCTPVECYGVVCDWNGAEGSLTAWANFQGPFTLHSVAAGALGLAGPKLRLITPPDSGGSFGIKSAVFAYVVLIGLASRKLGVPVRWIEDRLEHLAGSSSASGRATLVEAGFSADGELLALRYEAVEDVGAYVRAPEPATLYRMHGSLSGAYRVGNVAARNRVVLTNTLPSGLNRGFGGPQLYLALERTMTIAANRLGIDPAELRRRNLVPREAFPYRTASGALYDSGDYEACLDDALELARYTERRAEAEAARSEGRLVGVGLACVVEPSISNMGYITLAEPGETRGLPKSGNAEGCTIAISALGGVTVRTATTPQGQGHRTVIAQVVADRIGVKPEDVEVLADVDTSTSPWTIASGNYSSRFSGVGVGAVAVAAGRLAEKISAIRDHIGDETASLRRVAGTVHWNPEALPPGMEPGLVVTAYYAAPNLLPPEANDAIASSASHGFVADVAVVEIDRETGQIAVLDYVTVHDAGRLLNPLLAEGQVRGGLAHGAAAALFERHVYDEDGNLLTGSFMDYLAPTAPDLPTPRVGHRETPTPFLPLGAKGLGEGTTMSVPAAVANAVADALGRDDVEPPFTPGRVWELLQT
jgi:2-furoyl-CoA dehydrogenase large subunit